MFKKNMILTCAILLPLLGLSLYQMSVVRSADLVAFQKMIQEREIASSNIPSPTNQHRRQVRKDIWFSQDATLRPHYRIASEGSLLTLTPIKNKFEIVEVLQGIKCWMQQKLYVDQTNFEPMQQTRFIEAKDGTYRYTTQEFVANGVTLSFFTLPGYDIPTEPVENIDPIVKGIAQNISFFFSGNTPQFQAQQFEATMVKE